MVSSSEVTASDTVSVPFPGRARAGIPSPEDDLLRIVPWRHTSRWLAAAAAIGGDR